MAKKVRVYCEDCQRNVEAKVPFSFMWCIGTCVIPYIIYYYGFKKPKKCPLCKGHSITDPKNAEEIRKIKNG